MDIATILGFVSGIALICWGIMGSGDLLTFIHPSSLAIVLGGTIASTLISFPLAKVTNTFKVVKKAFFTKPISQQDVISQMITLANVARKEGLLALEEAGDKADNYFMKKGIMLIVDGTDPELVRNVLETELNFLEERHQEGQSVLNTMAAFSPAFGMVGTLIGLINMLKELSDPTSVGPNMSVALITTFYGTVFANLIFTPLANKLKGRSNEELLVKEMIVEGLLSIQAGENPRIIEEKLITFVPPKDRKETKKAEGEA
ncbi:motility protein A [Abyssisolibacter fermentans]|uniref:motility protein A n=1 Tax=Abyssisolibacter fermentans TaxID=1766203 RepID=UPI00082B930C|nr:motility protein A [Abyssisolibacter fermentans]